MLLLACETGRAASTRFPTPFPPAQVAPSSMALPGQNDPGRLDPPTFDLCGLLATSRFGTQHGGGQALDGAWAISISIDACHPAAGHLSRYQPARYRGMPVRCSPGPPAPCEFQCMLHYPSPNRDLIVSPQSSKKNLLSTESARLLGRGYLSRWTETRRGKRERNKSETHFYDWILSLTNREGGARQEGRERKIGPIHLASNGPGTTHPRPPCPPQSHLPYCTVLGVGLGLG